MEQWGWTVSRINGEGGLVKKKGMFSLLHIGRQGACHEITKSADSQKYTNFSENDCMIAEILQKLLSNSRLQTEDLRKQESISKTQIRWRQMLVASQLSRNKFLVIVVKIYTEADFKVSCPILLNFFTYTLFFYKKQ